MTIKTKLYLIGAIAILGLVAVFAVDKVGSRFIDRATLAHERALEADLALQSARKAEKNYLVYRREADAAGLRSAVSSVLSLLDATVQADPLEAAQAEPAAKKVKAYRAAFMQAVEAVKAMGTGEEEGLRAEFHYVIQTVDDSIRSHGDPRLLADMLELRMIGKDYDLAPSDELAQTFNAGLDAMLKNLEASTTMGIGLKYNIMGLLEDYRAAFAEYAAQADKIEASRVAASDEAGKAEKLLKNITASTKERLRSETSKVKNTIMGIELLVALLLAVSIFFVIRSILGPLARLQQATQEVAEGDFDACGALRFSGELEALRHDVVSMVSTLKGIMDEAEATSREAAEQAEKAQEAMRRAHDEKERGAVLVRKMADVGARAADIATELTDAASQLAAQADQITAGADLQQTRAGETAAAMEEMNATVMEVARNASDAATGADDARDKARQGAQVVVEMAKSSSEVAERSRSMKESLERLGEQAQGIGAVMDVINDIADQTNLLALNAAIEAARAGDAGRGFAVVADEVRKLAEKTMMATQEVGTAITGIQQGAKENIAAMGDAEAAVNASTKQSAHAGDALQDILHLVEDTADRMRSIATAAEEQSATSEEINSATDEINRISTETSQGMRESSHAIAHLTALAGQLQSLIAEMDACHETDDC